MKIENRFWPKNVYLKPFIIAADFLKKAAAVKRKMLKLDIFSLFIEYCLLLTRVKKFNQS